MISTALDQKHKPLLRKECLDPYPPLALLLHDLLEKKKTLSLQNRQSISANSHFASLSDQDKTLLCSHCVLFPQENTTNWKMSELLAEMRNYM